MPFSDDPLRVEQLDETWWRLLAPIEYQGAREVFRVGPPLETDFASVPRIFWWLVPRYGRYAKASVLHDHLCAEAAAGRFSRCDADGIFRRSMREEQVPFLRRWLMWAAVRWGGGLFGCGLGQALLVLLITVLAAPFVLPAALLALVSIVLLWVIETVVFGARRALPGKRRTTGVRPTILLRHGEAARSRRDGEASAS